MRLILKAMVSPLRTDTVFFLSENVNRPIASKIAIIFTLLFYKEVDLKHGPNNI